jgi:transposase-like protein
MPLSTLTERNAPYGLRDAAEFAARFPDETACLEFLWRGLCSEDGEHALCPRCRDTRRFKRYQTNPPRKSWTCTACGYHLHPTVGTVFEGSATPLRAWFYAIFLAAHTERLTARSLQRSLGVTYKTAWRMLHHIRERVPDQESFPRVFDRMPA